MGFGFYCTIEGQGCIRLQQLVLERCLHNGLGCTGGEKALTGGEIYGPSVMASWPDFSILAPPKKRNKKRGKGRKKNLFCESSLNICDVMFSNVCVL